MMKQVVKDSHLRVIGNIESRSDGMLVAHNPTRQVVGYFDPKKNVTWDSHMHLVGEGNQLEKLLQLK